MISYPISTEELKKLIEKALPETVNRSGSLRLKGRKPWIKRAQVEYQKCVDAGKFIDNSKSIWNELKPIFGKIQGDGKRVKCAYCERLLPIGRKGKPDGDIDHFRPKSKYHRLAYSPRNFVLSCRICNQDYKRDAFPINDVKFDGNSENESALLIHPLDPNEPRLEEVMGFDGIIIETLNTANDFVRQRGAKMIEVFDLNGRDDLRRERAKLLVVIYLSKIAPENDSVAKNILQFASDRFEGHANCALSYLRLWDFDTKQAKKIGEEADLLLLSLAKYEIASAPNV